ncbi:MAG: hypothetical protein HXX08_06275 [Chloroflexi bacterium]|uniref:Uncharacterized protein n=1 Tax=Candidatus Chlorohelix allophototropha TaxID=3003348 RepID=A0A8T7LTU9_9CHLR|nr:hypothetical protein [Chloroflexota bacterium]WJW67342.1 hypothetical protein OZ401_000604 [Chloroflexota bacterium L227-S17]
MTDQEVIAILANCKALAAKIQKLGVDFALNQNDSDTLLAFKAVYQSGRAWSLLPAAGLTQQDYLLLGKLVGRKSI